MAYARKRTTRPKRYARKRKTVRRPKRTYKKKASGKRRILNVTSRKKSDTMIMAAKNDPITGVNLAVGIGPTVFNPIDGAIFVFGFQATARTNQNIPGVTGSVYDTATRTSTTPYMRGLKEHITIETENSGSLLWRRICFTFVGQEVVRDQVTGALGFMYENSNPTGWMRTTTRLYPVAAGNGDWVWDNIRQLLFKGTQNIDWVNVIDAATDKSRVTVKYDRTRRIYSNNDAASSRKLKLWHAMNKTLTYNDEEEAGGKISSPFSANVTRRTMGDYYVIDIFALTSAFDGGVSFSCESELFWHER